MKRKYSLKKNKDFQYIYRLGKKCGCPSMALVYKNSPQLRVGFSISKKIGNSVVRNKLKRRMKEAFLQLLPETSQRHSYIFIARDTINGLGFSEIKSTMRYLLNKASLLKAK